MESTEERVKRIEETMKRLTERKTGNGHNRAMLLRKGFEMGLSENTENQISLLFRSCGDTTEELEQKAKEILEVMETCQTEEEVIKKLGLTSR